MAGGIYDQDPALLEQWAVLFTARTHHEKEQQLEKERAAKNPNAPYTRRNR